jgi:hypothetical protein
MLEINNVIYIKVVEVVVKVLLTLIKLLNSLLEDIRFIASIYLYRL